MVTQEAEETEEDESVIFSNRKCLQLLTRAKRNRLIWPKLHDTGKHGSVKDATVLFQ